MARGKLLFKGDDPKKKKKKKSKHSKSSTEAATAVEALSDPSVARLPQSSSTKPKPAAPKVVSCTGEITTSGTVVSGIGTKFEREIAAGDALIVNVVNSQSGQSQQEMRVVTMRLSNISISISSAFSDNIRTPTSFSVIRKPRDEAKQRRIAERNQQLSQKEEEEKASGTFGSTEELVYRERTEHGSYRIKRAKVDGEGVSREALLNMRSKKTSDKYC